MRRPDGLSSQECGGRRHGWPAAGRPQDRLEEVGDLAAQGVCSRRDGGTIAFEIPIPAMIEAYCTLHELGLAHSVESWAKGELAGMARSPGMSAAHMMKGRNKRSLVLDLKQVDGLAALQRPTQTTDVFVHNLRPQAARKLGIDYETVVTWQSTIIYATATGFGEDGPYAERPAYDDLIQGMAGMAGLSWSQYQLAFLAILPHICCPMRLWSCTR